METITFSPIGREDIRFGTGTFEVTLADGRVVTLNEVDLGWALGLPIVNVQDPKYGAIGDGVANDTAAIRKALNDIRDGGVILFPPNTNGPATYLINDELRYRSNQTWWFLGDSLLKLANASVANLVTTDLGFTLVAMIQPEINSAARVTFLAVRIDGNKANNPTTSSGDGLNIAAASFVRVLGANIQNVPRDGLSVLQNSENISIDNVIVEGAGLAGVNGGNGIVLTRAKHVYIKNFYVRTNLLHGIDLEPNAGDPADAIQNVTIESGWAMSNDQGGGGGVGVQLYPAADLQIRGVRINNVLSQDNYRGFAINSGSTYRAYDVSFEGCSAYRNDREGFYLDFQEHITMRGCYAIENSFATTNTYSGFRVHRVQNQFSNCIAYDNQGGAADQRYGFEEATNANDNTYFGCFGHGNVTGIFSLEGGRSKWVGADEQWVLNNTYMDIREVSAPTAPQTNVVRVYNVDQSGVSQFRAVFATGAARVMAYESPPSVTGSRGGNAALANLLTSLASTGLIVDNTTA